GDELLFRNTPPHRFDPPETVFLKRLLQDGLPEAPRRRLLDELFVEYVSPDERAFAEALYLAVDDLRMLRAAGMDVAAHGDEHRRLALLDAEEQGHEIDASVSLLELVAGGPVERWAFCYP